jgi:phosphohistidine phosphatase SixA
VKVVNKYKPMRIYATEYKRAQSTVAPLSKKRNLPVKTYDAGQLKELAAEITSFKKGRRIVVVGHSNTTPALANLLVKADQYRPLDESEYDQIWLIRIKKGKVRAELLRY